MNSIDWKSRSRAAAIHLLISLAVAALVALWVFLQWYPHPYRTISGGRELFEILVAVDVALGPLITLAIFNRTKPARELRRDLTVVGLLQVGALAYGLWTVYMARPVHLAFEFDRYRVVHAIEVAPELLDKAPPGFARLPLLGPTLVAVRPFRSEAERMEATLLALQGVSLSSRPDLWEPYETALPRVKAALRPLAQLKDRFPDRVAAIDAAVARAGRDPHALGYLPMVGRKSYWTALVDPGTAQVVAYLPIDSF